MNTFEEWEMMTEEQKAAWKKGHTAGYRFGLNGTPTVNPYDEDDPLYTYWKIGYRQGYNDS